MIIIWLFTKITGCDWSSDYRRVGVSCLDVPYAHGVQLLV